MNSLNSNLECVQGTDSNLKDMGNGYEVIPISTGYIKPGESYDQIIQAASKYLEDGDFLVISETPIAISQGRVIDEKNFKPSFTATLLADVWSRYIWGYFLGPLFRIKRRTVENLRKLPKAARNHKQLILDYYGFKHALKPASEAGVDLSNVPGTSVCLLPENPEAVVADISTTIMSQHEKDVTVVIADTDVTYQIGGTKFTSIPLAVHGIKKDLGIFGYLLGRVGKVKGPTPLAASRKVDIDKLIEIAKIAEDYQKEKNGSMETVYDMNETFNGDLAGVTIEMLESVEHTPAVIVRE